MSPILDRSEEGKDPFAIPMWDTRWTNVDDEIGSAGDWVIEDDPEALKNYRGFRSTAILETAIIICLFTDAKVPKGLILDDLDKPWLHRGGWHGDTFDVDSAIGERPIGSLLWTLERAPFDLDTKTKAEHYSLMALQTLVDQEIVTKFEVEANINVTMSRLEIWVKAFGTQEQVVYANAFPLR